jgi:phosphate acetyltransferase
MAKSLYIASLEPDSGKLLVTLGVMEMLSRKVGNLGFFRPISPVRPHDSSAILADNDSRVIRGRYSLSVSEAQGMGVSHDEARAMIAGDEEQRLFRKVMACFKEAEAACDFLLCEGPDISGLTEVADYDIGVRIARELGVPALCVVGGHHGTIDTIYESVRVAIETFERLQCPLLALIVNRVPPAIVAECEVEIRKRLQAVGEEFLIEILPEVEALSRPTMGEVVAELGAVPFGEPVAGLLMRDIHDFKVAAMSPGNFLGYLAQDDLVITPGDRSDIVLATVGAAASKNYPTPVGLLLTGGLEPHPAISRLLAGVAGVRVPMYGVAGDTFRVAVQASGVVGRLRPDNPRKIAIALGLFEREVDVAALEQKITLAPATLVSPLMFEYSLFERARKQRQHIVLPESDDDRILQAVEILRLRDVVDITLLGDEQQVRGRAADLGLRLEGVRFVDPLRSPLREEFAREFHQLRKKKGLTYEQALDTMSDISYFGTMMVHRNLVDGMVSGAAHTTAHTIRPAFQIIRTAPEVLVVSSVFLMCFETRVLVYGDCAINPNPTSEELAEIAISSAKTAAMFGVEPRVAMLSYSTGESGAGEDVERVRQAVAIVRSREPGLKVEGPIQYDAAIDPTVASLKMPGSEVAGRATVFIFPDLNTGNNTYKAVQRASGAVAIGPVLQGLNKPVNDLSRGCLVADIINTVAITAIQAQTDSEPGSAP